VVGRCGGCTVSARGCVSPGNMRSPDGASSWMVGLTNVARPVVPTICQHMNHHCSMPKMHETDKEEATTNGLTCADMGSCTTGVVGVDFGPSPLCPCNSASPGGGGSCSGEQAVAALDRDDVLLYTTPHLLSGSSASLIASSLSVAVEVVWDICSLLRGSSSTCALSGRSVLKSMWSHCADSSFFSSTSLCCAAIFSRASRSISCSNSRSFLRRDYQHTNMTTYFTHQKLKLNWKALERQNQYGKNKSFEKKVS
jgi:hypothetical protein